MPKRDLYNHGAMLSALVKRIPEWSFTEQNKKDILTFYQELVLENLSRPRIHMYMQKIKRIAGDLPKNLRELTEQDAKRLILLKREQGSSAENVKMYLITLRKFYEKVTGSVPAFLKEIKIRSERREYMKDILKYQDAELMSARATNLRDRAMPCVLYEAGARAGEFMNLKISDVRFDDYGIVLNVNGKTGQRPIRIIMSHALLAAYISTELAGLPEDTYLWCITLGKRRGEPITHRYLTKILDNLAGTAGIKKPCNPHHFRHSRATELSNVLTDRQMCQYFGWSPGSDMPGHYSHLSGRDIDDAMLQLNGMKREKAPEKKAARCARCSYINDRNARFCARCAFVLDPGTATEIQEARDKQDQVMGELMKDDQVRQLLQRKIQELGLNK